MFRFTLTPVTVENLEAIERLRQHLDVDAPLPRLWAGRLRRELEAEAVSASTSMEGVPVTVADVVRILAGDRPVSVAPADADLVRGYRDAMRHAFARAQSPGFEWNAELLLALHGMAMGASRSAWPGRFREGAVSVVNNLTGETVYECPPDGHVPALVSELCADANSSAAPAPVLAALVHVCIARIHPFRDGNGRVARIAASLAMCHGGYNSPVLTSLEEWWGRHARDYYDVLASLGPTWDPAADLTAFVEAHVAAQRLQVESLSASGQVERAIWTALENIAAEDLRMQPRAADALFDAFFGRTITNRYYRSIADVSVATAVNDLARMEAAGLVRAVGAGRTRAYAGTFRLLARVASECRVDVLAEPDASLEAQRATVLAGLADRRRTALDG